MRRLYFLLICTLCFAHSPFAQGWKELSDSLIFYYQKQDYEKAIPWGEKATLATKERFGADSKYYASFLTMMSGMYINTRQISKAIPVLEESLALYYKIDGEENKDYIRTLSVLAATYSDNGLNYKAAPLLVQAAAIDKKKYGTESAEYASDLNKLGKVYEEMGQDSKAETQFRQALAIREKINGKDHIEYATVLNNLALLYSVMGEYSKAEPLLLEALNTRKEKAGINSTDYANSAINLGNLYETIGQYEKARTLYEQAITIYRSKRGENSPEYITSINNLALLEQSTSNFEKAKTLLESVDDKQKKLLGENHPSYLITLNNLANIYQLTGNLQKAEAYHKEVIRKSKKVLGEKHPDYASDLNDLAFLYREEKRYAEAEQLYLEALSIFKEILGEKHPAYAMALSNLAVLYIDMGKKKEAEQLLSQSINIGAANLQQVFNIMSEKEKSDYIVKQSALNHVANSFLYNYPAADPSFYQQNYNLQLLLKGLSLTETKSVLDAVRNSPDSLTKQLFSQWQQNKVILSRQYSLPFNSRRKDLKELEDQTNQLEKDLARVSIIFRDQQQSSRANWRDVQQQLADDEATIEFVNFNLYDQRWTDTVIYAAYIIRKNDAAPIFVPLTTEKQLSSLIDSAGNNTENMLGRFYRGLDTRGTAAPFLGNSLYKQIWEPMEPYLVKIKKIDFCPSGLISNFSLRALSINNNQLLMDRYQLDQYTSTRVIASRKKENASSSIRTALLIGNPAYTTSSTHIKTGVTNSWNDLPGTATEIKKISEVLRKNNISTTSLTRDKASEENIKALSKQSPQLLHIATHGFFLPLTDVSPVNPSNPGNAYMISGDPLLKTGLVLAGGNAAWNGQSPREGVEDGIVTAYEIAQLDLGNTELVVLSACETALGDIRGSEGVFGLQRAFKMAGAKKLILSLWQVPDKETAELMQAFYTNWVKGKDIRAAFTEAQNMMRKKYAPYYWAAFVLIE